MLYRTLAAAVTLTLATATAAIAHPTALKWPPWISIETPVNPFDPSTQNAIVLVHTMVREGQTTVADLSGSAEGVVGGKRQSVALRFDNTSRPGVYAVRRQWPTSGPWVLRIVLLKTTTALVTVGPSGDVMGIRVPTQMGDGHALPRPVAMQEVDSTLTAAIARP